MKNLPLSMQIWLVFIVITLLVAILLSALFPRTLRDFFTTEIYATIESAQDVMLVRFSDELTRETWETDLLTERRQHLQNIRTVNHFVILDDPLVVTMTRLPADFINKVMDEADRQGVDSHRYSARVDNRNIFYVISKDSTRGQVYLVSYMWDTYREGLVKTLFQRLSIILVLVFLFSWLPSLWLARYLSNPLVMLEQRVNRIARRDWHEPVELHRKDEIGRLGSSIEQLRSHLVRQDEAQQSFLQHVSHELKTPVMVIRGFTQSIRDGIFPKGDLASSVKVIDEEAERLEKRIRNLLYLNKLDYLETHKPVHAPVQLHQLVAEVVELFRWRRSELDWKLALGTANVIGDRDQLRVALENLLDNQLRYAQNSILVTVNETSNSVIMRIWNDGPAIEHATQDTLFEKFRKGYKGEFGLGLAIVRRIAHLHGANVHAVNENNGVSFYLEFPKS